MELNENIIIEHVGSSEADKETLISESHYKKSKSAHVYYVQYKICQICIKKTFYKTKL